MIIIEQMLLLLKFKSMLAFEINWDKLNSEFDSEKNKGRREQHRKTHNKEEIGRAHV